MTASRPMPADALTALTIAAVVALSAAGCGSGTTPDSSASDGSGSVLDPQPSQGDGLTLRIAGEVEKGLLCPGGRRPCLPFEGSIEPGDDGFAWVSGRLTDGVFVIDEQQPLPGRTPRDYSNRCPDQEVDDPPPGEVLEALYEDPSTQPPGYADLWDSNDGVLHLGVAGDPAPAQAFLDELAISDQVCLVTGFPYSDALLEEVQQAVADAATNRGFDGFAASRDSWEGTVNIDLPEFDQGFQAQMDEISAANGGVPITALAGVEVINGSLDDYEDALASIAVTAAPQLTASCGAAVFSSVPPDLDEFPPLDADAKAALDELVNGPTGVEAVGFDRDYRWSIASRNDDRLVLFGQGDGPDGSSWVDARFERRAGEWAPIGWGGCRVEIGALGLGPARVATDPDLPLDPSSTELAVLINEQNCASGRAPIGREIVPLVTETDESVTAIVLVAPVEGGADCQGNPWHPITITLESPLGSRQLLDGHRYPPQPIGPANLAE